MVFFIDFPVNLVLEEEMFVGGKGLECMECHGRVGKEGVCGENMLD